MPAVPVAGGPLVIEAREPASTIRSAPQQPAGRRGTKPAPAVEIPRLELTAPEGAADPIESRVTLDSPAWGPAEWFARSDRPWLTVQPATGVTPTRVVVRVDPRGLPAGTHTAMLRFVDDAREPMLIVPVTLTIVTALAEPARAAQPAAGTAKPSPAPAAPAAAPAGQAARPPEAASAPLAIALDALPPAVRNLPYAQVVLVNGGLPPYRYAISGGPMPMGLVFRDGAITGITRFPGTYAITVGVQDSSTPPQTTQKVLILPVVIASETTALSLTRQNIMLAVRAGQKATDPGLLGVMSRGPQLAWSASADARWLVVAPTHGLSPAQIQVSADASSLSPGTYTAVLTVTMEGTPNSPMRILVLVSVRP
jgi:hypothetical protein